MSSILKALKKVEMESAAQTGSRMPWPGPSSDSPPFKSRGRQRWIIAGFIAILVVCGLVYWQIDLGDVQSSAETPVTASAKDTGVTGSHPDDAALKKNESFQKALPPAKPAVKADSAMASKSNQKVGHETIPPKGVLVDVETKSSVAIQRPPAPDVPVSHAGAPYEKNGEPFENTSGTRQTDENAADEEKADNGKIVEKKEEKIYRTDPRITLQALVWAPEPESRFVVINNQMIREGGTVDNIVVEKINPDDVLLSEGGNRWYCAFTIR